ncbi:MAG: hypothetical protein ACXAAI_02690 [Promethearchaeota archaeon]|jgi:hypothetical protein
MKQKEKLKCPICSTKFIPRTFYPEEAVFSTSDGKKLSGFNGYISSTGVKPSEVILSSWISYCPNCNYVLKFVKEIVKKEKIQTQNTLVKDTAEKYNNYYFGFPFEDYSQHLTSVVQEVKDNLDSSLTNLNLSAFESMHEIKDTFKLLVRFYANLENYCNSQFEGDTDKDLEKKIKLLTLSPELEQSLLEINELREKTINGDYELNEGDRARINEVVVGFILSLIEKHVKPLIEGKEFRNRYQYVDIRDLNSEIKMFLKAYFSGIFSNGRATDLQVKTFLDQLLIIQK